MEKIAIISDIHGNLEALTTVLNDIEKRNIKLIYCLGDIIAKGTHSKECLELIKEKCQIIIKGNCDDFFSKEHNEESVNETSKKRIIWNQSKLELNDRNYLLSLPFSYEFYMSGSLIRLFHSTPENLAGFVASIDSIDKKREQFLPTKNTNSNKTADIVIYGHNHLPYLDKFYNKTLINVGSVGNPTDVIRKENFDSNPMETTQANYLILEGNLNSKEYNSSLSYQFVRIPYDIKKELSKNSDNPELDAYITELTEAKYRDPNKILESFKIRNIDISKL